MIIIDGHNLLHAIAKNDESLQAFSDIELCRIIDRYLRLTGRKGEIVFDGTGPRDKSAFERVDGVEILFAGAGSDADSVIEEKIRINTAPKRLMVVSSDRRLRKAARARKANSIKSEDFWDRIIKKLSRKRPIKEPSAKRTGLSESETKQWLKFFDLEE